MFRDRSVEIRAQRLQSKALGLGVWDWGSRFTV